jgi:hypothetical protein
LSRDGTSVAKASALAARPLRAQLDPAIEAEGHTRLGTLDSSGRRADGAAGCRMNPAFRWRWQEAPALARHIIFCGQKQRLAFHYAILRNLD